MALLLDLFGFLSVVIAGLTVTAQSIAVGGIIFVLLVADPARKTLGPTGETLSRRCRRLLAFSAIALAATALMELLTEGGVLAGSTDLSVTEILEADYFRAGLVKAGAALAVALVAVVGRGRVSLPLLALVILVAAALSSHGASRLDDRSMAVALAGLHMAGAAIWVGGIPYFLIGLVVCTDGLAYRRIGSRFSLICMAGVSVLLLGGIGMATLYLDSLSAFYGTAYGVMLATKILLMGLMLLIGAHNFFTVERLAMDPTMPVIRLRRFAEVELGIGIAVFLAASSLTSVPPAIDLVHDRVTLQEIADRLAPTWPRLTSPDYDRLAIPELQAKLDAEARSRAAGAERPLAFVPGAGLPPPSKAEDIAWSEYNHHWAGLAVLLMGLLALIDRAGDGSGWSRPARHWPALFLVLAVFLAIRSDPETWPLGEIGFFESLRDPEVIQHRLFVALIIGFGLFEWSVRVGSLSRTRAALVFPLLTAIGGTLMLTHSHTLGNIKQELLIELTHVPIAVLGIVAGWARWLELRLEPPDRRLAGWVWPICFALVGLALLAYREV